MSDLNEQEIYAALNKSKLMDDLYANEKTRGTLLNAMKTARPDLSIPEVDARAAVLPELEAARQELREVKGEITRDRLMREYDMTPEELAETAKFAQDNSINRFDIARELKEYREAQHPRNARNSPLQMPDTDGLFNNPKQWALDEAHRAIADFKRGKLY